MTDQQLDMCLDGDIMYVHVLVEAYKALRAALEKERELHSFTMAAADTEARRGDRLQAEIDALKATPPSVPSIEAAHAMGAKGGPVVEAERLAFESWMRGHCWALGAEWDGSSYRGNAEHGECVDSLAMQTRKLWAAWRDRAALAAAPKPGESE